MKVIVVAVLLAGASAVAGNRPETWFHIIGGNASKAGVTADLEALNAAGIGGIQFFHGQLGRAMEWDGVAEQIPCLGAKGLGSDPFGGVGSGGVAGPLGDSPRMP